MMSVQIVNKLSDVYSISLVGHLDYVCNVLILLNTCYLDKFLRPG